MSSICYEAKSTTQSIDLLTRRQIEQHRRISESCQAIDEINGEIIMHNHVHEVVY